MNSTKKFRLNIENIEIYIITMNNQTMKYKNKS